MQIRSDQSAGKYNSPVNSGSDSIPLRPRSGPATRLEQPSARLIPDQLSPSSSSAASTTRPQFQEAHGDPSPLSAAMRDAIGHDDWKACMTALGDSSSARVDAPDLLWHAAKAGANSIAFRLQSQQRVSAFLPDMKSCAFQAALKNGHYLVAREMLRYHSTIEEEGLPDLKPYLEAAVDDGDSKGIAWLVDFCFTKKLEMPFELLRDAIDAPNAGRVTQMISHPSFAAALNDPESERLFLSHAVAKGTPAMLGLLLSRKRCAKYVGSLCEKSGTKGNTLLHRAAASGDPGKLKLILDFDPTIRKEGGGGSFFAKLMQGDGGINVKNNQGKTALAIAIDAGHTALATMLGARGAQL